jgi:type I restriction enzyme S subunit
LEALAAIEVPVPDYDKQLWFGELQTKVRQAGRMRVAISGELGALLPSILDKAFQGEL